MVLRGVRAIVQVQVQQEQVLSCRVQVLDQLIVFPWVEIQVVLRSSRQLMLFHRVSSRGAGGPSGLRAF